MPFFRTKKILAGYGLKLFGFFAYTHEKNRNSSEASGIKNLEKFSEETDQDTLRC